MHLSLTVMGPFAALLDGEPVTGFQSNKARGLLAYLAVERGRPHARETLAGLLWPQAPNRQAHHSLNQALSNLRTLLHDYTVAPPFLLVTPQTLQFNPHSDHWLDVQDFEDHLALHRNAFPTTRTSETPNPPVTQSPGHLVTRSSAPFLEGLCFADCPELEEWIVLHRERLHRLAVDALRHDAEACARCGDYEQALACAWQQIDLDPWLEEAHAQVMRWLAATGRRSEALVQYHLCRRLLARELGLEPAAGTTRLYQRIRDGEPISPGP
jgi:DNA-binding SARP family transcriptional activator